MHYTYLHGFASSAQSIKGLYLKDCFARQNRQLELLDFNQNNFQSLTLTRQIQQVQDSLLNHGETTLIGSSFGGLTAAWVAQLNPKISRLILLAPAFDFLAQWLPTISQSTLQQWSAGTPYLVHHYGYQKNMPLDYGFVLDVRQYNDTNLDRVVPTLILHGQQDEIIPFTVSRNFTELRSWVTLCPLISDHSLTDVLDNVWQQIQTFCQMH